MEWTSPAVVIPLVVMVAVMAWRLFLRKKASPEAQQTGDDIVVLAEAVAAHLERQQRASAEESGEVEAAPTETLERSEATTLKPGEPRQ